MKPTFRFTLLSLFFLLSFPPTFAQETSMLLSELPTTMPQVEEQEVYQGFEVTIPAFVMQKFDHYTCTYEEDGFFLTNLCAIHKGVVTSYDISDKTGKSKEPRIQSTWYSLLEQFPAGETSDGYIGRSIQDLDALYNEYISESRPLGDIEIEDYSLVAPTYGGVTPGFFPEFIEKNGKKVGIGYYYAAYGGDASAGILHYQILTRTSSENALYVFDYLIDFPYGAENENSTDWWKFLNAKGLSADTAVSHEVMKEYIDTVLKVDPYYVANVGHMKKVVESMKRRDFTDTSRHTFANAIRYVQEHGIVSGYADGTYRPDMPINRAEFVKIMVSDLQNSDHSAYDMTCFTDTMKGAWYTPYVCHGKVLSLFSGYGDGTFRPAQEINLAEALKILFNAYGMESPAPTGELWYSGYINSAKEMGLFSKVNSDPAHALTRGEMAELIVMLQG